MQVGGEFDARVPDPDEPEHDLPGPGGEPVACRGRVDVLAYGDDERYWLVHHRLADDGWVEVDDLLIDDAAVTACWAWERCFLDVELSGTIHNEVRTHPLPAVPGASGGESMVAADRWRLMRQHGDGVQFRRTVIPRDRAEIDRLGRGGWMMGRGAAPPSFGRHDDPGGDEPRGGGA